MDDVLDVRPLRHPGVQSRGAVGETTLVGPNESTASRELNEVAARIWSLCDGRRTVRDIAAMIVEEFDVDLATARHDTAEFVQEMLADGLLLPGNGAST
ncbi:MAG TPA: PqqD family protein [Myxococcales bacterium]|nr:PqqD family protein [Myxococcales bacterium]